MLEHRGLGVPVALGAHVDAIHDDVDGAAALREPHDAGEHPGGPVQVLRPRVHGDARAAGHGHPLDGQPLALGEIEGRDDAPTLGLGQGAHAARGVAEQQHAAQALVEGAERGSARPRRPGGPCSARGAGWPAASDSPSAASSSSWKAPAREHVVRLAAERPHQLVGVEQALAAGLDHAPLVRPHGGHGRVVVVAHAQRGAMVGRVGPVDLERAPPVPARGAEIRHVPAQDHDLDAQARGGRRQAARGVPDLVHRDGQRGPHVDHEPVPERFRRLLEHAMGLPHGVQRGHVHALERGHPQEFARLRIALRVEALDLHDAHQALVRGVGLGAGHGQEDLAGGGHALQVEVGHAREFEPLGPRRVEVAREPVLDEVPVRAAQAGAAQAAELDAAPVDRKPAHAGRQIGQRGGGLGLETGQPGGGRLREEHIHVRRRVRPGPLAPESARSVSSSMARGVVSTVARRRAPASNIAALPPGRFARLTAPRCRRRVSRSSSRLRTAGSESEADSRTTESSAPLGRPSRAASSARAPRRRSPATPGPPQPRGRRWSGGGPRRSVADGRTGGTARRRRPRRARGRGARPGPRRPPGGRGSHPARRRCSRAPLLRARP